MSRQFLSHLAIAIVSVTLVVSPLLLRAQAADHGKILTLTRTAVLFSQLESELSLALRDKDDKALGKLLAADFEQRNASHPGQPMPRADWLKLQAPSADATIDQIAVHDFGDTAVVSFEMEEPAAGKAATRSTRMLVDVWRKSGQNWQLAVRYQSPASLLKAADRQPDGKG